MDDVNYLLIAGAALVSIASPGPATLAIMGMSMNRGRRYGVTLALGILTGSLFWSTTAAFGLGAIMQASAWVFETLRYLGAAYLIYLSYRSIRSALSQTHTELGASSAGNLRTAYTRGLLIHLTNPKAILFFGALYSIAVPTSINLTGLLSVIVFLGSISACIFLGYACLFSSKVVRQWYIKLRRVFECAFAILFGMAGIRILLTRSNG